MSKVDIVEILRKIDAVRGNIEGWRDFQENDIRLAILQRRKDSVGSFDISIGIDNDIWFKSRIDNFDELRKITDILQEAHDKKHRNILDFLKTNLSKLLEEEETK